MQQVSNMSRKKIDYANTKALGVMLGNPGKYDARHQTQLPASRLPQFDITIAIDLLKKGADPATVDGDRNNVLHKYILSIDAGRFPLGEFKKIVDDLVDNCNLDIDAVTKEDLTALALMLKKFDPRYLPIGAVMALIRKGANANTQDEHGNTVMHNLLASVTSENTYYLIVELRDKYNADMNLSNSDGRTAQEVFEEKYGEFDRLLNNHTNNVLQYFNSKFQAGLFGDSAFSVSYWDCHKAGSIKQITDLLGGEFKDDGFAGQGTRDELRKMGFEYVDQAPNNGEQLIKVLLRNELAEKYGKENFGGKDNNYVHPERKLFHL